MDIALLLKAMILGVVEGISEFLPISSTGYLILTADVLNFWTKAQRDLLIVVIQFGAILAVIYAYFARLWQAFIGLVTGKADALAHPRRLGIALLAATLPVMVLGLLLAGHIGMLFHPVLVAVMLIVGAGLIIYVEKHPPAITVITAEQIPLKTAIGIGLCQCLALLPGTSRSGATIIGAVYLGVSKKAATEFSFFLGIPVIIGAALLDLLKHQDILQTPNDWAVVALGTLVSFVVALLAIRWLVAWVANRDLMIFAYLRIITGMVVLAAYFIFGYRMEG